MSFLHFLGYPGEDKCILLMGPYPYIVKNVHITVSNNVTIITNPFTIITHLRLMVRSCAGSAHCPTSECYRKPRRGSMITWYLVITVVTNHQAQHRHLTTKIKNNGISQRRKRERTILINQGILGVL